MLLVELGMCGARCLNEKGSVLLRAIAEMVLAATIVPCTLTQPSCTARIPSFYQSTARITAHSGSGAMCQSEAALTHG
jgi:hypothetical protein